MVAGPVPEVGDVTVSQAPPPVTVHAQPAAVVTVTLPDPPSTPSDALAGAMLIVQTGAGVVGESPLQLLTSSSTPPHTPTRIPIRCDMIDLHASSAAR